MTDVSNFLSGNFLNLAFNFAVTISASFRKTYRSFFIPLKAMQIFLFALDCKCFL